MRNGYNANSLLKFANTNIILTSPFTSLSISFELVDETPPASSSAATSSSLLGANGMSLLDEDAASAFCSELDPAALAVGHELVPAATGNNFFKY